MYEAQAVHAVTVEIGRDAPCGEGVGDAGVLLDIGAVGIPYLCYQSVKLRLVIVEAEHCLGSCAAEFHALADHRGDVAQRRNGHTLGVGVEGEHLIGHPRRRGYLAVAAGQLLRQRGRVDIVVRRRRRNLGLVGVEESGNIVVVAIVVGYVGDVSALLEHITGAREIVYPRAGLLCPSLVTVEPLSVDLQSLSRNLGIYRLMGTVVDDDTVDAAGEFEVGDRLEQVGREGISQSVAVQSVGGKGFGGNQILTIDVSHRRRFAYVTLLAGLAAVIHVHHGFTRPHRTHRDSAVLLDSHAVGFIDAARLVALEVGTHIPRLHGVGYLAVEVLLDELSDGSAPVEEEPVGLFAALYDGSRQCRHPRQQFVAASGFELFCHSWRPVGYSCLITVDEQVLESAFAHHAARGVDISGEIGAYISLHSLCRHLVDLESGRLGRRGMVHLARERVAEAQYAPAAHRRFPREPSGAVGEMSEVYHISQRRGLVGLWRGVERQVDRRAERGFLFGMVHAEGGKQVELADGEWTAVGFPYHSEVARRGRRDVHGGQRGTSQHQVAYFGEVQTIIARFQPFGRRGPLVAPLAVLTPVAQSQCPDGVCLVEFYLYPSHLAGAVGSQFLRLCHVAVGEHGQVYRAVARRSLRAHLSESELAVGPHRHHGDVLVVGLA